MKRAPVRTQLGLSGLIAWSSDTSMQLLSSDQPFDVARNVRFSATFMLFGGPANLIWLRFLDRRRMQPVYSVMCDIVMFYPAFLLCIVSINEYIKVNISNESKQSELTKRLSDFPSLVFQSWCYWIPVQMVNFTYIPLNYRLIVVQSAAYFWNMFLSYNINK